MAGIYLGNNVGLKIATIDISSFITSITLTQNFDEVEVTTMGNSSHVFSKGLENSTLQVSFLNNWDATSVCATLQAAYGTTVTAVIIPVKGTAVSATNPLYTVSLLINNLTPVGTGGPGDETASSITWTANSTVVQTTTGTF